jgi:tetratricopeptide (TPR) repeat protein
MKKIITSIHKIYQKTDIRKPDSWLGTLVSLIFRIGTLLIIIAGFFLIIRLFKEEGYSIDPFSVPENLVKNGFDGNVLARQLKDEYSQVKEEAKSIKSENFQTVKDSEQPELSVSVMGFGLSIKSIAFQLRELMGRKNRVIACELTQADNQLGITLRMTDFKTVTLLSPPNLGERAAIKYLHRKVCEQILRNTDPYRLSLYFQRSGKYNEGLEVARNMLVENPTERQWAMLAMGNVHEEINQKDLALKEFDEATKIEPNFALAYMRHAWLNQRNRKDSIALPYVEKALKLMPNEPSYWNTYALILNYLKRYDESDRAFAKVFKLEPNQTEWYRNWASCKAERGEKAGAKELLQTAIKMSQKINQRILNEINLAEFEQDTALVLKLAMQLLDYEPNNIGIVKNLIQYYWKQKQYGEITKLNIRLRYNQDDRRNLQDYYNYRAMAFNMLKERDSALVNVKIAIDLNPQNPYPYTTIAEIAAMNGDKNGFYTGLEKAFKMGFPPEQIEVGDLPYKMFLKDARYLALVKKYRK